MFLSLLVFSLEYLSCIHLLKEALISSLKCVHIFSEALISALNSLSANWRSALRQNRTRLKRYTSLLNLLFSKMEGETINGPTAHRAKIFLVHSKKYIRLWEPRNVVLSNDGNYPRGSNEYLGFFRIGQQVHEGRVVASAAGRVCSIGSEEEVPSASRFSNWSPLLTFASQCQIMCLLWNFNFRKRKLSVAILAIPNRKTFNQSVRTMHIKSHASKSRT